MTAKINEGVLSPHGAIVPPGLFMTVVQGLEVA